MINLRISGTVANSGEARTLRLGMPMFWALFGIMAITLTAVLALLIGQLPTSTPLSHTADIQQVRDFILNSNSANDPFVQITPDIMERSSSVRGLSFGGQTYYYYFEGRKSYDPLNRGRVRENQIERVLRDDGGDTPLVIYTVKG